VFLAGGAGTGKTTIAQHVAESLNLPFYFTGAVFAKHELLGYTDINHIYNNPDFRKAFEFGGVFLFDEKDASDPSALVAFNAALANRVCSFPDGETIRAHKDFIAIAAANTKGKGATREYAGRSPIDGATLDRYVILDIEIDETIERDIVAGILGAHFDDKRANFLTESLLTTIRDARKLAKELQLSCIISPRAAYDAAKGLTQDLTMSECLTASLWNKLDATSRAQLGA
jgi:MoxR-like ATPase